MPFWITAFGLTLITAAFLVLALLKGRTGPVSPAAFDLKVYRDQLSEVDRDLARGVLSAEDADRVRTEISRRILAADAQVQIEAAAEGKVAPGTSAIIALSALVLLGGSFGLYSAMGNPGYPDLALSDRLSQARATLEGRVSQAEFEANIPLPEAPEVDPSFRDLVADLRDAVKDRPNDLRGYQLLAQNEATLRNYHAAYQAQAQVIALKGEAVTSLDHTQLADLMIRAAQGYISPEASAALGDALALDPGNGFARYYTGLLLSQTGRPDMTFRIWRDLLEIGPEAAPWIAPIRARIDDLAWMAGVDYSAPNARGPSAADLQAADELSDEDRAAMVQSMVAGLADRLGTEGGTAQEWAQLISAYGVLGEIEKAQAIWEEAQTTFESVPADLAIVAQAARGAGLNE